MLANALNRRGKFLLTLLLVVLPAAPALAEIEARPTTDNNVSLLARVDGQLRPVSVQSAEGSVRLSAGESIQLCVVDLSKQALPATSVGFDLTKDQSLRLEVLDLDGKLVRTLARGLWAAGKHQLAWQHDAETGDRLDEGLYVVRLVPEAPGEMVALAR